MYEPAMSNNFKNRIYTYVLFLDILKFIFHSNVYILLISNSSYVFKKCLISLSCYYNYHDFTGTKSIKNIIQTKLIVTGLDKLNLS